MAPDAGRRHVTRALLRRASSVGWHGAAAYLPPVLGALLSLLVVRLASVEVWGRFVAWAVPVQLAVHVAAWGNKEHLLREIARSPGRLRERWRTSLVTRFTAATPVVVLAAATATAAGAPADLLAILALWWLGQTLAQSFEVLVVYRRAFATAVTIEAAAFAPPLATVATAAGRLEVELLVAAFAAGAVLRTSLYAVAFRRAAGLPRVAARPEPRLLAAALPFFLLSFSGMLMSRTDLYCVVALLDRAAVGAYQVLTTFLLALQGVAALVVTPWVKGLYRLPSRALWRTAGRLSVLGAAVTLPGVAVLAPVLEHLYRLDIPSAVLAAGALSVLPAFPSVALIYLAFRGGRQAAVVWVNLLGAGVNLALNLALLPRLGLLGAVTATAAAQWTMLAAHLLRERAAEREAAHAVPELR